MLRQFISSYKTGIVLLKLDVNFTRNCIVPPCFVKNVDFGCLPYSLFDESPAIYCSVPLD